MKKDNKPLFTCAVYANNTWLHRIWLTHIGYRLSEYSSDLEKEYLFTSSVKIIGSVYGMFSERELEIFTDRNCGVKGGRKDCRESFNLFLALTALSNDTDYMQWFVSPRWWDGPQRWYLCTKDRLPLIKRLLGYKKADENYIIASQDKITYRTKGHWIGKIHEVAKNFEQGFTLLIEQGEKSRF